MQKIHYFSSFTKREEKTVVHVLSCFWIRIVGKIKHTKFYPFIWKTVHWTNWLGYVTLIRFCLPKEMLQDKSTFRHGFMLCILFS